jgi:hypothetical protein
MLVVCSGPDAHVSVEQEELAYIAFITDGDGLMMMMMMILSASPGES